MNGIQLFFILCVDIPIMGGFTVFMEKRNRKNGVEGGK